MVKTHQNLELFRPDLVTVLSILESRKTTRLSFNRTAEDYNLDLLQNGLARAVKRAAAKRGLRKSSSLTNGIGPVRNKTVLKEYGTEARGLNLSPSYNHLSMRPSWTPPLMRSV